MAEPPPPPTAAAEGEGEGATPPPAASATIEAATLDGDWALVSAEDASAGGGGDGVDLGVGGGGGDGDAAAMAVGAEEGEGAVVGEGGGGGGGEGGAEEGEAAGEVGGELGLDEAGGDPGEVAAAAAAAEDQPTEAPGLSPQEATDRLFMSAVLTVVSQDPPSKSAPVLISTLFGKASKLGGVGIKQTSWKKTAPFLVALGGCLQTREPKKGVMEVTAFNRVSCQLNIKIRTETDVGLESPGSDSPGDSQLAIVCSVCTSPVF